MFEKPPLLTEFRRLQVASDPHARGTEFETLVKRLFDLAHFSVTLNPRAAEPRQTDLVATYDDGRDVYLIEAKWQNPPAGVDDIDNLRIRLDETHGKVLGVFVSVSGFSNEARMRVEDKRVRPILLIDADDLEDVLARPLGLQSLLRSRTHELVVNARAVVGSPGLRQLLPQQTKISSHGMPIGEAYFLIGGQRQSMASWGGDFGQFVFVQDVPDIDWVPGGGFGVTVDLAVPVFDEPGLVGLFGRLAEVGWLTPQGRWNIQQATTNWHGIGAASLVEALEGWSGRYQDLGRIHHTEDLCYQDVCQGGFYTLTVGIGAHELRNTRHCDISLQLKGVPVDAAFVRQLATIAEADEPLYFRPRNKPSVELQHLYGEAIQVEPIGFVAFEQPGDRDDREWVCGLIVPNPFSAARYHSRQELPDWLPGHVDGSEMLICSMGQWHPVNHPVGSYWLERCEWAWTSDGLVFSATADWDDLNNPSAIGAIEIPDIEWFKPDLDS